MSGRDSINRIVAALTALIIRLTLPIEVARLTPDPRVKLSIQGASSPRRRLG